MPNSFATKLRKHVRTKRLEDVQQLGTDRVIDFKFGSGETAFHVLLEFFAAGNIILTDHEYVVLSSPFLLLLSASSFSLYRFST